MDDYVCGCDYVVFWSPAHSRFAPGVTRLSRMVFHTFRGSDFFLLDPHRPEMVFLAHFGRFGPFVFGQFCPNKLVLVDFCPKNWVWPKKTGFSRFLFRDPLHREFAFFRFRPGPRISLSAKGRPRPEWPETPYFAISCPWGSGRSKRKL